jgi:predicted MFS family arabinose efflux permease
MSVSKPLVAATQFTSYMAVLNLSMTAGQKLGGWIAEWHLPLAHVLVGCALFHVATMGLLHWMAPREKAAASGP